MTEHNIEIPCNTEVVIRVSCKEVAVEAVSVIKPTIDPVVEIIPEIDPATPVEVEPIVSTPVIIDSLIPYPIIPSLPDPLPPVIIEPTLITPVIEPIPISEPENCYCDLTSSLSLPDFVKQLTTLTRGLLYPSESEFPIEVLAKGFSSKMPPIRGIEVRSLDRVIPNFLRNVDPDDQQAGNLERATLADRWQALYTFIKNHCSVTAWHYPVKQNKFTHELIVLLLHPQGTVALRIKLVET